MIACIGFMILFHIYAFILESFLWTKPIGLKTFQQTREQAESTRVLAFNQGFYNLLLALGLALGLAFRSPDLVDFGAVSALVAGLVLAFSLPTARRAAVLQGGPALLYLALRFLPIFGA